MELRDTLPGDRAVICVEQEDELVWLGSKKHISEQAREEFIELFARIEKEGWPARNWPGR